MLHFNAFTFQDTKHVDDHLLPTHVKGEVICHQASSR